MLIQGDARKIPLADKSVNCCVTSPPYWGLRDYGIAGQLGLERTPEEYIAAMLEVFREVKRVLRDDGTLWLNMGDSYHGSWGNAGSRPELDGKTQNQREKNVEYLNRGGWDERRDRPPSSYKINGLKPKDLVGIPWMLAFALRADGWYLRSDIIWSKPNPMPESVTDRPTKAHEYLFLLAKGQWKTSVVQLSDLSGERFHFGCYIGSTQPSFRSPITKFCVSLATTFFESAQRQNNFSLPPFYSEKWKQILDGVRRGTVVGLPGQQILAACSACFLSAEATAKEFIEQFYRLWLDLGDANHFLVGRVDSECSLTPTVNRDSNGAVTVYDSGEICKFDFPHNQIVLQAPTTCKYYYNQEATLEPWTCERDDMRENGVRTGLAYLQQGPLAHNHKLHLSVPTGWNTGAGRHDTIEGRYKQPASYNGSSFTKGKTAGPHKNVDQGPRQDNPKGRNKRTVWEVATQPFPEAHFTTFPEELIKPCILAGCPPGGTVLDPFVGSGTTVLVARNLQCKGIGLDLNPAYIEIAKRRLAQKVMEFGSAQS